MPAIGRRVRLTEDHLLRRLSSCPITGEQRGSSSVSLIFLMPAFVRITPNGCHSLSPDCSRARGPAHPCHCAQGGAQSQPGHIWVQVCPRHGMEKARSAKDTARLKSRNREGLEEEESKTDESLNEQQPTVSLFIPHLQKDVIFWWEITGQIRV